MERVNKLVLGTVQFGCQYGINSAGRPDEDMVAGILRSAFANGISLLDTSSAYGDAEQVLGRCIAPEDGFRLISKYPSSSASVREVFEKSLENLGVSSLYGYMLHHFSVYRSDKSVWKEFRALREEGKCGKAGFSLYEPEELEMLLDDDVDFDLLQIPRNIFDRKFDSYLPVLKERGVEVHVRSTFLQGLFFKDRDSLPAKLAPLGKYLRRLDDYAGSSGLSIAQLALNYNLCNPCVSGVLIGVDNLAQLMTNIGSVKDIDIDLDIEVRERELLSPVNWN